MPTLEEMKKTLLSKSKGRFISSMGEEQKKPWLVSPAKDLNRILSGSLNKSVQINTHTGLVGPEACVSEDTVIPFERFSILKNERLVHKDETIKNLYNMFHGIQEDKDNIIYNIKSINEKNEIIRNFVVDVVKTGKKECFKITTVDGQEISTSKDHKFYIGNGEYKPLEELKEGNKIYIYTNKFTQMNKHAIAYKTDIKSIENVGNKETYDIKCLSPYNNYIANNFITHNSGKSSFMALLLADAQKQGFLPVVIDAEGAWDRDFVERWGLDPNNLLKINTLWVDDIMPELAKFIDMASTDSIKDSKLNLAIALDSVGALETKKVITDGTEKHDVKADQGRLQKDIKRLLKLIVSLVKFNNCVAFSAGHLYGNPTGYGEPEQLGGGKYYRLACDTIISLKKSPIYEFPLEKTKIKKGSIIGNKITAATLKNRKYPPFQEATIEIDYQNGVNEMAGLIDVAIKTGIINKGGAWYDCPSMKIKAQGEQKFMEELKSKDNTPFLEAIETHLKTTGYSSINKELELQKEKNEEIEKEDTKKTKKVSK